jgi:hypothetical protein
MHRDPRELVPHDLLRAASQVLTTGLERPSTVSDNLDEQPLGHDVRRQEPLTATWTLNASCNHPARPL